ncbi:4Fe-4S dicluster domain-containing protein [Ramlibacter sp. RBP-2]|uniref:4Fe-4S dicluster domain-containing protein n=1 Tax=Ramlibacter lithotrophicus TaxID=2606681 RepID=A0A7X6I8M3_9BURK|nr:4Fe-4S dicluster domain-containing protein [Ramlibacter lithotrophicus]NKE68439.1 4Fe-4S dicluster domain-containing protein [Ramlibacter lithotrophicus]
MPDHLSKRTAVLPVIARNLCTGCGWCVAACPDHLLVLEVDGQRRKAAELPRPELCPGCGKCLPVCNFRAIRLVKRSAQVPAGGP